MFGMIKFCLTFCLCFLLLTIPLRQKPLFYYLDSWAKPFTNRIFKHSRIVFWESVEDGKKFGKQIFNNSLPQSSEYKAKSDKVKMKSSATQKQEHLDSYTDEEKEMLLQILKN